MAQTIKSKSIPLPLLREDIELYPGPQETDGSSTWTIFDPLSGAYYRIGWDAYEIISLFPFTKDVYDLIAHVNQKTSLNIGMPQVQEIVKFLVENQLIITSHDDQINPLKEQRSKGKKSFLSHIFHSYIFFKIQLLNPNSFLDHTRWFAEIFFTKTFFHGILALLTISLFLTIQRADEFMNTFQYFFNWEGFIIYAISISIVKIFHEFGHAFTAKRNGLDVTDLGIAFIVMYPILYTDTTDSWKMQDTKKRRSIGLAGIITEFYLAVICLFLWHLAPEGGFKSIMFVISTVSFFMSLLINLNPLMRLDGYYIFSDYMGMDNLQDRSFELARRKMRRFLWGWTNISPERVMNYRTQRFITLYAYAVWMYRFFLFLGIALLVYNIFPKPFGLILMSIEIGFFIILPISKEIIIWLREGKLMKPTFQGFLTVLILGVGIWGLIHPWKSSLSLPAIVHIHDYQNVTLPHDAQVKQIDVTTGDFVTKGDVLVSFASPELEARIRITAIQIKNADIQLETVQRDNTLMKKRAIMLTERDTLVQELQNAQSLKDRLIIRSKSDGHITDLNSPLHKGMWIKKGSVLMKIVAKPELESISIHAYATEHDLPLIQKDSVGYFYDENGAFQRLHVQLTNISTVGTTVLPWPELSSKFGGPVAVDKKEKEEHISHEPLYHLTLQLSMEHEAQLVNRRIRGHVVFKAEAESFSSKLFKTGVALLNREFSL